jgi:hypothetical protein
MQMTGLKGDPSFYDMCATLLVSFLAHIVDSVATSPSITSREVIDAGTGTTKDDEGGNLPVAVVTCDAVLKCARQLPVIPPPVAAGAWKPTATPSGIVPYGQGGLSGIRFVLAPAILELCDHLSGPEKYVDGCAWKEQEEEKDEGKEEEEEEEDKEGKAKIEVERVAAMEIHPLWLQASSSQKCDHCHVANDAQARRCACCDRLLGSEPKTPKMFSPLLPPVGEKRDSGGDCKEEQWACAGCAFLNSASFAPDTCTVCARARPSPSPTSAPQHAAAKGCEGRGSGIGLEKQAAESLSKSRVYLSSSAVSVLHDMLVDAVDAVLRAALLRRLEVDLTADDTQSTSEGAADLYVTFAAGPVTLQRIDGCSSPSSDSTLNLDVLNLLRKTDEAVRLAPSPSLQVRLWREMEQCNADTSSRGAMTLNLEDIKAAVAMRFPDNLGNML